MTTKKKNSLQNRKIKIVIIDDHPIVRHGLAQIINLQENMTVCGDAANTRDGWDLIVREDPDLVILDISLEGASGFDLLKGARKRKPNLLFLVLSMHDENLYAERALRLGARGYIMKQEATDNMIKAITQILAGEIYLSEKMKSKVLSKLIRGEMGGAENRSAMDALTDRELEIYRHIGMGMSSGQIAKKLNLSIKTVETHRYNIKLKLELENSAELLRHAINWVQTEK